MWSGVVLIVIEADHAVAHIVHRGKNEAVSV